MLKIFQYGGRNRVGSLIQSVSGESLPPFLSNEIFDQDRTLSASISGLLGTVSGNIEFVASGNVITASITGLLGTVSSTAETTLPVYTITASINGLMPSISSNATTTVPQYNITTSLNGLGGVISSEVTTTVPIYEVSGNIVGLLGSVSGTLSTAQQFEISGNIIGILGGISASLQYTEPVIGLVSTEQIRGNSGIRNDLIKHRKKVLTEDEEIIHVLNIFVNGNKGLF